MSRARGAYKTESTRRKCVVVGDTGVGKTSLIRLFVDGRVPENVDSQDVETHHKQCVVDGNKVDLSIWDTTRHDIYDRLRPLSYPDSHFIVICFDVTKRKTFEDVKSFWILELNHYTPTAHVILVATHVDLRDDAEVVDELAKEGHRPVLSYEGSQLAATIKAYAYLECSTLTGEGVQEVFERGIRAPRPQTEWKSGSCMPV